MTRSTATGLTGSALILVGLVLMLYVFHQSITGYTQLVTVIIYSGTIIYSLYKFGQALPGKVGFKAFFSEGFKTFIVMTLVIVIFTFIYYKMNPGIMEAGIKENDAILLKEGNYTQPEIEANSDKLRSIFMPMMLSLTTILFLIIGSVVSLASAVLFNKKSYS